MSREFQIAMPFPGDSTDDDVESDEYAWSVEDFDDDEEVECPECGAAMDEDHDPSCTFVDDDDETGDSPVQ